MGSRLNYKAARSVPCAPVVSNYEAGVKLPSRKTPLSRHEHTGSSVADKATAHNDISANDYMGLPVELHCTSSCSIILDKFDAPFSAVYFRPTISKQIYSASPSTTFVSNESGTM